MIHSQDGVASIFCLLCSSLCWNGWWEFSKWARKRLVGLFMWQKKTTGLQVNCSGARFRATKLKWHFSSSELSMWFARFIIIGQLFHHWPTFHDLWFFTSLSFMLQHFSWFSEFSSFFYEGLMTWWDNYGRFMCLLSDFSYHTPEFCVLDFGEIPGTFILVMI